MKTTIFKLTNKLFLLALITITCILTFMVTLILISFIATEEIKAIVMNYLNYTLIALIIAFSIAWSSATLHLHLADNNQKR